MSCERQKGSSTDSRGSVPKQSVPHWCVVFFSLCECATTTQKPRRRRIRLVSATSCSCGATLFGRYCRRMRPSGSTVTRFSTLGRSSEIASQSTPRDTHASYAHNGIHGTTVCAMTPCVRPCD